jgi:hypothetical protein
MRFNIKYLLPLLLTFSTPLFAEENKMDVIHQGFKSLIQFDTDKAVKEFFKGSILEKDYSITTDITKRLNTYNKFYGKLEGYSLLKQVNVSPYVIRTYFVLAFKESPVYLKIDLYKSKITNFEISNHMDEIIPSDVYLKKTSKGDLK